jgi:hypothetical protein
VKMNRESLEEQIKKRADERVQERIKRFKEAVVRAANELCGTQHQLNSFSHELPEPLRQCFAAMASDNHRKAWPSTLWADERARVTDEVFATMNELQRVLLARGVATEGEPEVTESKPEQISA